MIPETRTRLAKYFDHTLLSATALRSDIQQLCDEAFKYGFYSVCVLPRWASFAADILRDTDIKVASVAGFPFGADTPKIKANDAREVIKAGADEVDMVADLPSIIEGDINYLTRDLLSVLNICRSTRPAVTLKVIIESAALTDQQIVFACKTCQQIGVNFIKTSTGLNPAGGASTHAVELMAQSAPQCDIKAAGGIKTLTQTLEMIAAGATRIGASASVSIMEEFNNSAQEK
ncbi:MAG: deoxyribose-phosphate aldolase [Anaerohalosphaera sp.]|nr:deoxyribose-phosphate aldolase [Anaerohalosphaera sp.]